MMMEFCGWMLCGVLLAMCCYGIHKIITTFVEAWTEE